MLWPWALSWACWVWCAVGGACKGPSQPHSCDTVLSTRLTLRSPCPAGLSELHGAGVGWWDRNVPDTSGTWIG